MVHAYAVLLRLYPEAFRRRYAAEMLLDFADALDAARAGGWVAVGAFALRALGDLAVSLLREWTRTGRLALTAATAGVTLLLWALALRPWAWRWDIQPGPPPHAPAHAGHRSGTAGAGGAGAAAGGGRRSCSPDA